MLVMTLQQLNAGHFYSNYNSNIVISLPYHQSCRDHPINCYCQYLAWR